MISSLKSFDNKLGTVQSYSIKAIDLQKVIGAGDVVTLQYSVIRTNYPSEETLILIKTPDKYLVGGYSVISKGLLVDEPSITGKSIFDFQPK